MIKFNKLESSLIKELNISSTDDTYALEKDGIIVGYGIINNNRTNKIEVFIKEPYRSNGYGKKLFGKMLSILKEKEYKEIKLIFSRDNYRIRSIIEDFGGLALHTDEKEEIYLLPIK